MAKMTSKHLSILRQKQVTKRTGIPRSTLYLRMKLGTFPKQIKIGPRSVGWFEHEIDAFLEACLLNENNKEVNR